MRSCAGLNSTHAFAPQYGKASPKPTEVNLSKRKRWTRVSSGCLTLDAYPLDANRRSGLAKHLRLPERTRAHLAKPTVIEIRKSVRSLKKFPQRGRMGREESTRELLHRRLPHIIAYRMKHAAVEILHIWHPSQHS